MVELDYSSEAYLGEDDDEPPSQDVKMDAGDPGKADGPISSQVHLYQSSRDRMDIRPIRGILDGSRKHRSGNSLCCNQPRIGIRDKFALLEADRFFR